MIWNALAAIGAVALWLYVRWHIRAADEIAYRLVFGFTCGFSLTSFVGYVVMLNGTVSLMVVYAIGSGVGVVTALDAWYVKRPSPLEETS